MVNHSIPDSRALGKFPFWRRFSAAPTARQTAPVHAGLLSILLLALLLWPQTGAAARLPQAAAPADTLSANATITLGPRTSTRIRLDAMRVDVVIHSDQDSTWADITTWLRFQNPLTRTLTLDALVQPADNTPPAESLQLSVAGVPQALAAEDDRRWRWTAPLDGQTRLEATLTYRVALGRGAAARLRYEPVRAWGGIGSVRLTVRFPEQPAADQLLDVRPSGYRQDGALLTWSYDNAPEIAPLDLIFVTTPAWRQLQAARQGAQAEALALARWYDRLARIEAPQQAFFARFYPQAVAVLDTAWREVPAQPESALLLADLYQRQAEQATEPATQAAYRTLAAELLAAVRAGGGGDTELDGALAALYFELAQQAQHSGAWPASAQFLSALAQLPAAAQAALPAGPVLALRQEVALALAAQQLSDGDLAAARLTIEQVWGPTALTAPDAARAAFDVQVADVSMASQRQLITMTLPLRQEQAPGAVDALQSALSGLGEEAGVRVHVTATGSALILQMQLVFSRLDELPALRARLAARVANMPDLALLHALLLPSGVTLQETESLFWRTRQISETLDLPQAQRIWQAQAQRYRQASSTLAPSPQPAATATLTTTISLALIQRRLWQEEATAWEALAQASEVRYRLTLDSALSGAITQTTLGRPEQPLRVNLAVRDYRLETMAAAGGALLLLALLTAWLWWRAG